MIASTLPANEIESRPGRLSPTRRHPRACNCLTAKVRRGCKRPLRRATRRRGMLCGSDPRYQAAIEAQDRQTTLRLTDTRKQLDQTWTITALDDRCFTFVLTVTNTGDKPLALAQICPLEGTFVEKHDPAKPHILLNGDQHEQAAAHGPRSGSQDTQEHRDDRPGVAGRGRRFPHRQAQSQPLHGQPIPTGNRSFVLTATATDAS